MQANPGLPPAGAVGALIAAIGLGIALWFGWDWYQLPRWSEAEITQSVELNLAMDLARMPAESVPYDEQARMRTILRSEIEAAVDAESELLRGYTLAGLLMAGFGLIQMGIRNWLSRKPRG